MKKLKIKKCMTGFLMLAIMVISFIGIIPSTNVYAGTFLGFEATELDGEGKPVVNNGSTAHDVYQFQTPGHSDVHAICVYSPCEHGLYFFYILLSEDSDFSSAKGTRVSDNGDTVNFILTNGGTASNHIKTFSYLYQGFAGGNYDFKFNAPTKVTSAEEFNSHGSSTDERVKYYVENYLNYGDEWTTINGNTADIPTGSADKPFEDKEIGHLILTGQKGQDVLPENRDTDAVSSYQVFKWKSKTDTGFSLTKNKYAQTRIEAKVESRCVIYKHMNSYYVKNNFTSKKIEEDNEVKEKFKNFGESATISKVIPADTLEYVLSFDKIDELLPKTAKEWHNDIYVGHNYRVYFRVLCTDSLTVIPDENDNSWHSGGWSYVDFSLDGVVSGNGNGHFDKDGKWTTDDKKDDINNGGRDTFIDDDAAKDDRDNSSNWGRKDPESDSGLDTSNIKGFMNQVGNVPKAIGKLFTFLPDWVTTFIAFGFVLLIALMIIKAIRG